MSGKARLAWMLCCAHTSEELQEIAREAQITGWPRKHVQTKMQTGKEYKSIKMGPTLLMNIGILAIVRPETGRIALIICVCRNPSILIHALWKTIPLIGGC